MNVLFVLENYTPHIGGVEVVFKNLCEGLVKEGHKVDVITHRLKGTKKFEKIKGVGVHRVNCFHSRYWFTFLSIPKVISMAKKSDIIHTTTFNGAFPSWLASKILNKPSLITIHEVWVGKWQKLTESGLISAKIHDILERMIYLLEFDKYVAVSKSTQNQLKDVGISKNKSEVVYNGVDYNHWNPLKHDGNKIRKKIGLGKEFVYMFSGRPGVSKGLEYLIKAVPEISKKIPNSKLVAIVSKDKQYEKRYKYIKKLIKKLGVGGRVVLLDPVEYKELPNYIKAANCVVVPSLAEGFGFAAAEACAMKKPVVASNTTSLPEVVSCKNILVDVRSPESIAKGVESVYNNKVKSVGVKKFLLEDNIKNYIDIYNKLVKK